MPRGFFLKVVLNIKITKVIFLFLFFKCYKLQSTQHVYAGKNENICYISNAGLL